MQIKINKKNINNNKYKNISGNKSQGNSISQQSNVYENNQDKKEIKGNHSVRTKTVTIITNILENKSSLSSVLFKDVLPIDQNLAQELTYGCLRWYQKLEGLLYFLLHKPLRKQDLIVKNIIILGLYQLEFMRIPEYAVISATVDVAKELHLHWASGLINAVLRNFLRNKNNFIAKLNALKHTKPAIYYSHPEWLIGKFKKTYQNEWQNILHINNTHPNMCLRVNQSIISRDVYLDLLNKNSIKASQALYSNCGILLEQTCNVEQLPHFYDGWVSIQDEASQLVVSLLELQPNLRVLDACSAPGGKTTHILETEPSLAKLVAVEVDSIRIQKIMSNLQRLGLLSNANSLHNISNPTDNIDNKLSVNNIDIICADINVPQTWWDGKKFDRILLDAPCSATGVIRRHPDIKFLRQPEDIKHIVQQQLSMLETLWELLADNGVLVYTTCSLLAEENYFNIARFIEKRKQLTGEIIQEIPIESSWGIQQIHGKQLLPTLYNDGFYYVKLKKL